MYLQAKKTSILVENKSNYSVIGGLASANGTFVASVWDILESNYVTSSNTVHAVNSLSTAGTFKVAFKETLSFNEETSNASITLKGRDGVNRATATVSQTPVKLIATPSPITFNNGQSNQMETVTITTSNDGTISSGLTISPQSNDWVMSNVSGNKIILKTTAENDTGLNPRVTNFTITYKGTKIILTVNQKCDFNPSATVNIGGIEWMKYNLGKSRSEGGWTYATKLPSECTDDPIKTKSHGRFYKFNIGDKSWPTTGSITDWESIIIEENSDWVTTNNPCPNGYRLPTVEEFKNLVSNSTQSVEGGLSASDYGYMVFTSKNSTNEKLEFILTGYVNRLTGTIRNQGAFADYWSSTQIESSYAYTLNISSARANPKYKSSKSNGYSIRCVKK